MARTCAIWRDMKTILLLFELFIFSDPHLYFLIFDFPPQTESLHKKKKKKSSAGNSSTQFQIFWRDRLRPLRKRSMNNKKKKKTRSNPSIWRRRRYLPRLLRRWHDIDPWNFCLNVAQIWEADCLVCAVSSWCLNCPWGDEQRHKILVFCQL